VTGVVGVAVAAVGVAVGVAVGLTEDAWLTESEVAPAVVPAAEVA